MIPQSISNLYDGDYVLGSDYEGNNGIFVFHSKEGFLRISTNCMGKVVKYEKVKFNLITYELFRLNGDKILDKEIFGDDN